MPRRTVPDVEVIEQHLDEEPEAWAHSGWQFESPHNPHDFPPQFFRLVFRVVATVANYRAERIPICSAFSLPKKTESLVPRSRYFSEGQRGLSPAGRGLAGMMISRRPWRRASSEYAPGPRHKSAIAMTAVNAPETLADKTSNTGTCTPVRAVPRLIRAPRLQASRLNRPSRSNSPQIEDSAATAKLNTLASCQAVR